MTDAGAADPLAALEREVQALRTAQAEVERERAAIVLERAAQDAERMTWAQDRDEQVQEAHRLARELLACQQAAEQARLAAERAHEQEHRELRARLERALRWSPRHRLGVLAHRSATVRRLRRGPDA